MNIALFASAFYPHVGGVEEHVRQLAHACQDQGHTVIVITNRWPPSLPAFENYEGIPVYRLTMRVPEGDLKARLRYHLGHPGAQREMLAILRRHVIERLHVHCVSVNGHYALLARRALALPLIVTTHGERTIDASRLYERSPFMNATLRALLTEADAVTACSRHTLDDIETFYGQTFGARGRVVYNGIHFDEFARHAPYTHSRPYVFAIGRLVSQKGFDTLIEAFARADLPAHDLLLAGEGAERETLARLVRERRLGDRVHLLGRTDRPTTVSLFQGCDFFVLPSREEPFGIVNLEAMAAGKAVVAMRVGGVPEIIEADRSGLLVPAGDVCALTEALERVASDADIRQGLGAAGQARAQQFAWPTIAAQYLDIYHAIAD